MLIASTCKTLLYAGNLLKRSLPFGKNTDDETLWVEMGNPQATYRTFMGDRESPTTKRKAVINTDDIVSSAAKSAAKKNDAVDHQKVVIKSNQMRETLKASGTQLSKNPEDDTDNPQERSVDFDLPLSSETERLTALRVADDTVRPSTKVEEVGRNSQPLGKPSVTTVLPAGAPMYYDLDRHRQVENKANQMREHLEALSTQTGKNLRDADNPQERVPGRPGPILRDYTLAAWLGYDIVRSTAKSVVNIMPQFRALTVGPRGGVDVSEIQTTRINIEPFILAVYPKVGVMDVATRRWVLTKPTLKNIKCWNSLRTVSTRVGKNLTDWPISRSVSSWRQTSETKSVLLQASKDIVRPTARSVEAGGNVQPVPSASGLNTT